MGESYKELFSKKLKHCKSKKDYKRLCREMISQLEVIDGVDENLWKIFSNTIGEDVYSEALMLAVKMYMLERQGIPCRVVPQEDDTLTLI